MSFKTCLLSIAILFSVAAQAQDKIYRNDGVVIDAIVKTVSEKTIIFKRFDYQSGPDYTVLTKEVSKIVYQNGSVDNFDRKGAKQDTKKTGNAGKKDIAPNKYGNNMLSVIPGAYTVALDGSINDAGIGICYERQLDERGHISFNLPVIMSFSSNKDYNNDNLLYNNNGNYTAYNVNNTYTSFNIMPGIKFYPARSNERVRYALGMSFFVLTGSEPYAVYDNSGQYQNSNPPADFHYTMFGFMISNSVTINASKHIFIGLDANAGVPLSDNRHEGTTAADDLFDPWLQFALRVGYRF